MAASIRTIRIGYVPEHYLLPLHLSLRHLPPTLKFDLIPFPSGTGHMITSLRAPSSSSAESIDLAIGLTEGWIAGLLPPNLPKDKDKGYNIVGQWVQNPLRWAIVTGKGRTKLNSVADLGPNNNIRVGVSRLGSGSHVMASVLAQREGWDPAQLQFVACGPFADLRAAVNVLPDDEPQQQQQQQQQQAAGPTAADFFMWEHFTTKPYFDSPPAAAAASSKVTLKHLGEIYTPWPSWSIVASTQTFPSPSASSSSPDKNDDDGDGDGDDAATLLTTIFSVLDKGIADFEADVADFEADVADGGHAQQTVRMLGSGEIGCTYGADDAREWLKNVAFVRGGTRGVDRDMVRGVVEVLKAAGVVTVGDGVEGRSAVEGCVGIER